MGVKKKPANKGENKTQTESFKPKQQRTEAQQLLCDISDYLKFKQDKKLPDSFGNKIDNVVEILKQQVGTPSSTLSQNLSPELISPPIEYKEQNNGQNQEEDYENEQEEKLQKQKSDQKSKGKTPPPTNKTPPPANKTPPPANKTPPPANKNITPVKKSITPSKQKVAATTKQQVQTKVTQQTSQNQEKQAKEEIQDQRVDTQQSEQQNNEVQEENQQMITQESQPGNENNQDFQTKFQPVNKSQNKQKFENISQQSSSKKRPLQEDIDETALQQPLEQLAQSINQISEDNFSHFRQQSRPNGASEKVGIALLMLLAGVDSSLVSVINGKVRRDWALFSNYTINPNSVVNKIRKLPFYITNKNIRGWHIQSAQNMIANLNPQTLQTTDYQGYQLYQVVVSAIQYCQAYESYSAEVNQKKLHYEEQVRNAGFTQQNERLNKPFSSTVQNILESNRVQSATPHDFSTSEMRQPHELLTIRELEQELNQQRKELLALQKQQKEEEWRVARELKEKQKKEELEILQERFREWQKEEQFKKKVVEQKSETEKNELKEREKKTREEKLLKQKQQEKEKRMIQEEIQNTLEHVRFKQVLVEQKKIQSKSEASEKTDKVQVDRKYKEEAKKLENQLEFEERLWERSQQLQHMHNQLMREKQEILKTLDSITSNQK